MLRSGRAHRARRCEARAPRTEKVCARRDEQHDFRCDPSFVRYREAMVARPAHGRTNPIDVQRRSRITAALLFVLCVAVGATSVSAQCNATQLCAPTANPCEITTACTVPAGATFDLGNRNLVLKNRELTVDTGTAPVTIIANDVTLEPGSRIIMKGVSGTFGEGGSLVIEASGAIDIQSQGTSRSRISADANYEAGSIALLARGNVGVNGTVSANAASLDGFGGTIEIESENGAVTIAGMGVSAIGGNRGENGASGGEITISALGNVAVNAPLDASNGDCIACGIHVDSGAGNVTTTQVLNVRASGDFGDGGLVDLTAAGTVTIGGLVQGEARGSGGTEDGEAGTGGDLSVSAGVDVLVNANLLFSGSAPDGDGGTIDVSAGRDVKAPARADVSTGATFGFGGTIFYVATRDLVVGDVRVQGGFGGGDLEAFAEGAVTVSGPVTASGSFVAGSVAVTGCTISVPAAATISTAGPSFGAPAATTTLTASGQMTIAGKLTAGLANRLVYRSVAPVIQGTAVMTPAPVITQDPTLPCCGVCPTTTTSTTATTSTSTSVTTSSTSSTTIGSTSSTSTSTSSSTTSSSTSTSSSSTSTSSSTSSTSTSTSTPSSSSSTSSSSSSSTSTSTSTPESTTTTTLPTCPIEATFSSLACRLAEIPPQIVVSPDAAKFEVKLDKLIAKAEAFVAQGQAFVAEGRADRGKRSVARAITRVGRFASAVGSKKGQKALEATLRERLVAEAEAIRTDARLLAQSL